MTNIQLKFHGRRPIQGTPGAAGFDLRADFASAKSADFEDSKNTVLRAGDREVVATGTFVEIPEGYVGFITPRSGLAAKRGVTVLNAPGTIDADYRGELKVILQNHGPYSVTINQDERIGQLVIVPIPTVELVEVDPESFSDTERGAGGFGSTGTA